MIQLRLFQKSNKSLIPYTSNLSMFSGQHNLMFSMSTMPFLLYIVTLSAMFIQAHGMLRLKTTKTICHT